MKSVITHCGMTDFPFVKMFIPIFAKDFFLLRFVPERRFFSIFYIKIALIFVNQ